MEKLYSLSKHKIPNIPVSHKQSKIKLKEIKHLLNTIDMVFYI